MVKSAGDPVIFSMLSGSSAYEQGDELVITLPPATAPLARLLTSSENLPKLSKTLQKALQKPLRVRIQTSGQDQGAPTAQQPPSYQQPPQQQPPLSQQPPPPLPPQQQPQQPQQPQPPSGLADLARLFQDSFGIETRVHP